MNEEPNPAGTALRRFKDPNYRNLAESLADIRGAIDRIDEQIVALLAERGRYVKDAARFKRDAFQVFDRVVRLAHEQGAYPEVVEACYRTMVAGFIAREQADFAEMEPVDPAKATPGVSR